MLYPAELRDPAGGPSNGLRPVWEGVLQMEEARRLTGPLPQIRNSYQAASSAATSSSAFSPVGARLAFLERYSSSSLTA